MSNMNTSGEKRKDTNKKRLIVLIVLCLLLCLGIAITAAVLADRIGSISEDDEEVIALIPDSSTTEDEDSDVQKKEDEKDADADSESSKAQQEKDDDESSKEAAEESKEPEIHPGFEASDDEQVWTTDTKVEIFHVNYNNETEEFTVKSAGDDKVIAPGTENSYTFKFKNTGDVAIDYEMEVSAYVEPADVQIPVNVKMNRYDGAHLVGTDEEWEPVLNLNGVSDYATLGVNHYAYYTLDWQWPFESGNDEYDTMLGNMAVEEDITLTIEIDTVAVTSSDPSAGGGLVQTGDTNNWMQYVVTMAASCMLLILIVWVKRRKAQEDAE